MLRNWDVKPVLRDTPVKNSGHTLVAWLLMPPSDLLAYAKGDLHDAR